MGFTDVFKKLYPFLATAASFVPGGNIATTAIGQILNLKAGATLDDAGVALMTATPEQRALLQAEDNRHKEVMAQMGFTSAQEFEKIAAGDRDSARDREKVVKDKMPTILGLTAVATLLFCICLLAFFELPATGKDAILILLGAVVASYKDVYGYFFGSSAGSAHKDETIATFAAAK